MKESLIEILGLKADATEAAVIETVKKLQAEAARETDAKKEEAAVRALIAESHGALSYASAKEVLATRAAAAKAAEAKKAKK